jgi:pyruvate/2-oxoglutarate/acetoin dehydrogenase E1 component
LALREDRRDPSRPLLGTTPSNQWSSGKCGGGLRQLAPADVERGRGQHLLGAPIARLGARNVPMPYNDKLELATIPSRDDIMAAIRSVL